MTVLIFIGSGAAAGMLLRNGTIDVPVLTKLAGHSEPQAAGQMWPPRVGEPFPELKLLGLSGHPISLRDYQGRVMLVEPVAMSCAACQSFSGANQPGVGPFQNGQVQKDLESLETYVRQFAGTDFEDDRLMYVQILFYDLDGKTPPTVEQARAWAEHFQLNRPNIVVAIADPQYLSQQTRDMIPGFYLIDRAFQLRFDAGKGPRQDLYHDLLPALPSLLEEPAAGADVDRGAGSAVPDA